MSWTLGDVTLPDPQGFSRKVIESSVYHEMINATSKKDISGRKEQFTLVFKRISQSVVAEILAQYELKEELNFAVSDGSLEIASTAVHVDLDPRQYNTKGSEYREDFKLILTEVS